jgi:DNA-binding transcriptional LysR family regulator
MSDSRIAADALRGNDTVLPRFSLRQLRYFVVTAEVLSFTGAGKVLHVSQPSISTALADLEESFNIQLFVRHHASGLSLTPAGRDLVGPARALLRAAEELQSTARGMDSGVNGKLSVGCLVTLAPSLLPKVISGFLAQHAGVSIETHEGDQEQLLTRIAEGRLDVALTYSLAMASDVDFVPLLSLPPYVILPKDHPLTQRDEVGIADLISEPYIMLDLPHSREYFSALFGALGMRPHPRFRSSQPEVVRSMVANGLGYSILNFPLQMTRTVDGGEFAMRRFKDDVLPTTLGLLFAKQVRPRHIVRLFADFCAESVKSREGSLFP